MSVAPASSFADSLIAGGGEAGRLIAARDWSLTPLGPIDAWPQSLKTALSMILLSPVPIVMLWGEDGVMLYNDAYSIFAGGRHPQFLGSKVREGWPEVAEFNDNVMKVGLAGGTLAYKDQELTLYRHGIPEQVWMNLDYSPVLDERGEPGGVIAIVAETTERVLAERRQAFKFELEEKLRALTAPQAIARVAAEALGRHLKSSRVGYAEVQPDDQHVVLRGEWRANGTAEIAVYQTLAELCPGIDCTAGRTIAATVLVIDDDDDVRQFLVDSLEAMGHRVLAAQDGDSGLQLLDRTAPDVMVVDFAMAGMNGAEVAKRAREQRPHLPVIFASGYSDTAAIERVGGPRTRVLRKPFRVGELEAAVGDAWAEASEPPGQAAQRR